MSRENPRARLEGIGETALAALESVGEKLRQLGSPSTEPGKWVTKETYFRNMDMPIADLVLFEAEVSFEWQPFEPDTEPF